MVFNFGFKKKIDIKKLTLIICYTHAPDAENFFQIAKKSIITFFIIEMCIQYYPL